MRPRGGTEKEKKKEKEEEKIPHMCESIGHRPLPGRCPKGERKKTESDPKRESLLFIIDTHAPKSNVNR